MIENCVIGSGPTAVSTAYALLKHGRRVTMLDAGLRLEPDRESLIRDMAAVQPEQWTESQLEKVREGMESGLGGIPLKLLFGSDFPYREIEKFAAIENSEVDMTMSLAMGGLSNVWGAAVLPFTQEDIAGWPISISDLAPYYSSVLSFVGLAATQDDLTAVLPLYTDEYHPLKPSRQAQAFMRDLQANRERLKKAGFTFGYSRLAVQAEAGGDRNGCVYCGLCLYGCPYSLIYNSAYTAQQLMSDPNFTYTPEVVVERFEETPQNVVIRAKGRTTGEKLTFTCAKVFLGCGVIPTSKILLESLDAFDRPVIMKDSLYFLVPLLRLRGEPHVHKEQLHTLTQVCMELKDRKISDRSIHVSVYTYCDLFEAAVKSAAGPAGRLLPPLVRAIVSRTLVFGGYLHSDDSPAIEFSLSRRENKSGRAILMSKVDNPRSQTVVRSVLRKLVRSAGSFKGLPLAPFMRVGLPGRAFHAGGTFPMKEKPRQFECDTLGRPTGFKRAYVVDATCFPSIPATNITLTAMAHAYRVAEISCRE